MVVLDALYRLPVQATVPVYNLVPRIAGPVTVDKIASETLKDPVLSVVLRVTHLGCQSKNNYKAHPGLSIFFKVRYTLSILKGCLMFAHRVVVASVLQSQVLKGLHEGHPGFVRTKLLARSYVWWPCPDKDIEVLFYNCNSCVKVNLKAKQIFWPWPATKYPFERVHIDFLGTK